MNIEESKGKKSEYISFKRYTIVSCGTLRYQLNYLKENGFLNTDKILNTALRLHENPGELENQIKRQIKKAKKCSQKVIVVYESNCQVNVNDPLRNINSSIQKQGDNIQRVNAKGCIGILANVNEKEKINKGKKVLLAYTRIFCKLESVVYVQ